MADKKTTVLTEDTTPDLDADFAMSVDVSDTSMASSGTNKKVKLRKIAAAGTSNIANDYEESVRVATDSTDGNITLSGLSALQGITLVDGDRILPTAQTTGSNNRIWIAHSGAWTIASGWDVTDTVTSGRVVPVEEGDNAGSLFRLTTPNPITLGTTALTWIGGADAPVVVFTPRNVQPATYTLVPTDNHFALSLTRNGTQTITIAAQSSQTYSNGFEAIINAKGTGSKVVSWGASVTANGVSNSTYTIPAQFDGVFLKRLATNDWLITLFRSSLSTATAADFRSNTVGKTLFTDPIWSAAAEVTLTDAATIAVDMSTFINAKVTLGGNRTLGQPSNTKVGQCGVIRIIQDGTGSRTLAYHADWFFAGGTDPTLSTAASAEDLLFYQVIAANKIFGSLVKAIA